MLPGMSRNSPSGPIEATDFHSIAMQFQAEPAGEFIVIAEEGFLFLQPNVTTDPAFLQNQLLSVLGLMTRAGRLGFVRISEGVVAPLTGAITLQWAVNGVKKGNAVDLSLANVLPANPTIDNLVERTVDFGEVEWVAGDFVQLLATVGTALVGGGTYTGAFAFDMALDAGRPRTTLT